MNDTEKRLGQLAERIHHLSKRVQVLEIDNEIVHNPERLKEARLKAYTALRKADLPIPEGLRRDVELEGMGTPQGHRGPLGPIGDPSTFVVNEYKKRAPRAAYFHCARCPVPIKRVCDLFCDQAAINFVRDLTALDIHCYAEAHDLALAIEMIQEQVIKDNGFHDYDPVKCHNCANGGTLRKPPQPPPIGFEKIPQAAPKRERYS
jgi:hypothetical protein